MLLAFTIGTAGFSAVPLILAMYVAAAKRRGRDQVVMAGDAPERVVERRQTPPVAAVQPA